MAARTSGRLGKWLVSGPPLLYLTFFFAIPTLIMVLASFRTPGEFGGLAPFIDEAGQLDLNLESYARFFDGTGVRRSVPEVGRVCAGDDVSLPGPRVSARRADRDVRRSVTAICCCCS